MFIFSNQTTFAEVPVDRSKVRQVNSKSALRAYLDEANKSGRTIVPVILTNGLSLSVRDLLALSSASMIQRDVKGQNAQNTWSVLTLKDYPGTRVANAYLGKIDKAWLSTDEMKLYKVASAIADKSRRQGELSRLHGRFLHARSNVRLERRQNQRQANGEPHMWNTISYGNGGSTYFIDATFGDELPEKDSTGSKAHSYIYFNAPVEIMQVTHSWDSSPAPPNLQPDVDSEYFYSKFWGGNLARAITAEAGLQFLANALNDGKHSWHSCMTPYDEKFAYPNVKRVISYLDKIIRKKYYVYVYTYGRYLFFTAYLR